MDKNQEEIVTEEVVVEKTVVDDASAEKDVVTSHERNVAMGCWALILVGAFTGGILSIVGMIASIFMKGENPSVFTQTHSSKLVKTFIVSLGGYLLGLLLAVVVIGWFILFAVFGYNVYVSIKGLMRAQEGKLMS